MSAESIRQRHRDEALACLEEGQPLIYRPSDAESSANLLNPDNRASVSPGASPPQRRGRRDSRDGFKFMSVASSLGVSITALTFPGSNFPTGGFGPSQYGTYDDFNAGATEENSSPDLYSSPSEHKRAVRNSFFPRQSYQEPTYQHHRRSHSSYMPPTRASYMPPSRRHTYMTPVPRAVPRPMPRQESFAPRRPSSVSNVPTNSTDETEVSDRTDHTTRRRRFQALVAKLAKLFGVN